MAGQGISGVFMNVLMMVTKAALESTLDADRAATVQAWIFFSLAGVVIIVCIFAYISMVRRRFIRYHVPDVDQQGGPLTREEEEEFYKVSERSATPTSSPGLLDKNMPPMPSL